MTESNIETSNNNNHDDNGKAVVLDESMIDSAILNNEFVGTKGTKKLRITCYGSSSSRTPTKFMTAARSVGYILSKRGHVCVNGAGAMGCMGAMNEGCLIGNGDVIGVIHEMFMVDGRDLSQDPKSVFSKLNTKDPNLPYRELIVASGNDLQERKKLLIKNTDAILVLPGGPGTWDELWEMACIKQIGLNSKELPIVCVNTDGYYNPFQIMLQNAAKEGLLYTTNTADIVHFVSTPIEAIQYIETKIASNKTTKFEQQIKVKKRMNSFLSKRLSYISDNPPAVITSSSSSSNLYDDSATDGNENGGNDTDKNSSWNLKLQLSIALITGIVIGMSFNSNNKRK